MAYLTLATFKAASTMPEEDIDQVELVSPGWVDAQLAQWSAWIDSRLRKRYDAPFSSPYPVTVTGWLSDIVTLRVWFKRGVDATDEQFLEIKDAAKEAKAEVLEAANGDVSYFDLPLRADTDTTGISRGGPLSYSEASPYVAFDVQRTRATNEDGNGGGTYG